MAVRMSSREAVSLSWGRTRGGGLRPPGDGGRGEQRVDHHSKVGKLVRDRIPLIIREGGAEPVTYTAGPEEYRGRLRDKLGEEVAEFLAADEESAPEELADVLEVLHALAADLGVDADRLETIRQAKATARGAFADRIVWTGNR